VIKMSKTANTPNFALDKNFESKVNKLVAKINALNVLMQEVNESTQDVINCAVQLAREKDAKIKELQAPVKTKSS
jgi:hypothetical protein